MVGAGEVGRLKTDVGQVVSTASGAAFSVVVTGEWRQRRLYDVGWRDSKTFLHSGQEGAGCHRQLRVTTSTSKRTHEACSFLCVWLLFACLISSVDRSG